MLSSFPLKNRLILFFLMVLATILLGSLGYGIIKIFVEHQQITVTDAIYFSVITISTLGHYPAGMELESEIGKWFTIFYIIFGLGVIFGGIQALLGPWIEIKVKQAIHESRIPIPEGGHVVIAGYNDVAKMIKDELELYGIPYVIVDENAPQNSPIVAGKPTSMENLKRANIERAKALLAVGKDEDNAATIITARKLNERLNIIALASREGVSNILLKCGANSVVSRTELLRSTISKWVEGDTTGMLHAEIFNDITVEEFRVDKKLNGKFLANASLRERVGTVIAIYRGSKLITNPSPKFTLQEGDVLIILRGVAS
jgi:voltage-gated potassium channel